MPSLPCFIFLPVMARNVDLYLQQLIYYDTNAKGNKIAFDAESITVAVKDVIAGKVSYKNSENIVERMVRVSFSYLHKSYLHPT